MFFECCHCFPLFSLVSLSSLLAIETQYLGAAPHVNIYLHLFFYPIYKLINWAIECIPQSRIKRSYTREVAPQTGKQSPSKPHAIYASSLFFNRGGGGQQTTATQICLYIHHPIKKYIPARLLYTWVLLRRHSFAPWANINGLRK